MASEKHGGGRASDEIHPHQGCGRAAFSSSAARGGSMSKETVVCD